MADMARFPMGGLDLWSKRIDEQLKPPQNNVIPGAVVQPFAPENRQTMAQVLGLRTPTAQAPSGSFATTGVTRPEADVGMRRPYGVITTPTGQAVDMGAPPPAGTTIVARTPQAPVPAGLPAVPTVSPLNVPAPSRATGPNIGNMSFGEAFSTGLGLRQARTLANIEQQRTQSLLAGSAQGLAASTQNAQNALAQQELGLKAPLLQAQGEVAQLQAEKERAAQNLYGQYILEADPAKKTALQTQLFTLLGKTEPQIKPYFGTEENAGVSSPFAIVPDKAGGLRYISKQELMTPQQRLAEAQSNATPEQIEAVRKKFAGRKDVTPDMLAAELAALRKG